MLNEPVLIKSARRQPANVSTFVVYLFFALFFISFSSLSRSFFTFSNFYATILDGAPLILIACGINFALLTGVMDLSVAGVAYASGCLCGILMKDFNMPILLAICAGLLIATLFGGINSIFIVRLKMNGFVTTLGMMMAIRGIGKLITQDKLILMGKSISRLRQMKIEALGGFPVVLFVVFGVVLISQIVLSYTRFGKYIIAVGCDDKAARNVGINVGKIRSLALITTSLICGIAGVLWVISLGAVIPRGLNGYEFLAIAAAVIGGTSLFGGRGTFFPGSFIGALILLFIADGLTILGVSPYAMPFMRGAIIFAAMYADSLRVRFG